MLSQLRNSGVVDRPGHPARTARPARSDRVLRRAMGVVWRGPDEDELRAAVGGRIVLVTGASSGIGEATARRVAAAGGEVLLVARRVRELERLRDEIAAAGGTAHVLPANLADEAAVAELIATILARHGAPDVIVSNAGHSIRRPVHEAYDRYHDYARTIAINYLGPVQLILGLLPGMRARGSGHLVNIGTIAVDVAQPSWSAYTASKSAFEQWLRSVGAEARTDGIAWSTIHFALVRTAMSAPTEIFKNMPGMTAAEAADAVCRVLVDRPRMLRPWWARWQAMGSEFSPTITDWILVGMYRADHVYLSLRERRRPRRATKQVNQAS